MAEHDHRQLVELDLDDGQVGFRIEPDHFCRPLAPVGQHHLDLVGGIDDVVIGQDVAFGADDDARAQAHLAVFVVAVRTAIAKEFLEKWVPQQGIVGPPRRLAGEDIHHGRHRARRRVAVGTGRRRRGRLEQDCGTPGRAQLHPPGPVGPGGRIHQVQRQQDGHRLRKQ